MTREFEERNAAPYADRTPLDAEALRITNAWHRHPAVHESVWHYGVNLGEMSEYLLLPDVVKFLVAREGEKGS